MRLLVTFAVTVLGFAGCGYDPHPRDGKLPCTEGCPSGYECRCDQRCWRRGADGGACSVAPLDAQDRDSRPFSPEVALDGRSDRPVDAALDAPTDTPLGTGGDVALDLTSPSSAEAGETFAEVGRDARVDDARAVDAGATQDADAGSDAPLPVLATCIADHSKFDECSFGP